MQQLQLVFDSGTVALETLQQCCTFPRISPCWNGNRT
jgi:hypothetical protein